MNILNQVNLPKNPTNPDYLLELFRQIYVNRSESTELNLNLERFFNTLKKIFPIYKNQSTGKDPKQFYLDFANILLEYLEVNILPIESFLNYIIYL